ncbi:MAG: N-acetylglucosamine-6-phosphate deacetylase [Planctomycetales bacterium]|nr:N-acetylglucosamine-6-phosphate deacetylase [Planctomycetales bacterium]
MSQNLVFSGGTAILPDRLLENAVVVCRNGQITDVGSQLDPPSDCNIVDVSGRYLMPGLIDMHVHGGAGADFMDGTVEAVSIACQAHVRHGTTTLFPTTTTGSPDQLLNMIRACQQASDAVGARIPGVHLYGPFFAENKVGCHSLAGRRSPGALEFDRYFETGFVRIATCAAELPGAQDFYQSASAHSCLITCGHSDATWSEMHAAFDLGMRHVDHFWCAMSSVSSLRQRCGVPMQASMAEFVLMQEEMSTEVIADGWHLSPELLEFAFRMKGSGRLCLVTDSNRAMDMVAGEYRFGNCQDGSWFYSDGNVGWALDRSSLASSVVGLDHMVRHMFHHTSATLPEVVAMASLTPAQRTGIDREVGSIEAGKHADLVIVDKELRVEAVYIQGKRNS